MMIQKHGYWAIFFLTLFLFSVGCQQPPDVVADLVVDQAEARKGGTYPTLADFWEGSAEFKLVVADTGLPMGESETLIMSNGHFWSYVHASDRSAGVRDRCGDPVEFPGCTIIYYSLDGGYHFTMQEGPVCQFSCNQCPCNSEYDHIDQQQYPDISVFEEQLFGVYEFRGSTQYITSADGQTWSKPVRVADTGIFRLEDKACPPYQRIGQHPFVPHYYDCLAGAPPGIFVENGLVYVFVAMGHAPAYLGCYKGRVDQSADQFTLCDHNPLFAGAQSYGPLELRGAEAHPYWDFRTISSAELYPLGSGPDRRYYLMYEGIRGPGPNDPGDTQFGLGLARSKTAAIDGPWETFAGNPLLVNMPANIGIGHADLVIHEEKTILYTSLDGVSRSRLELQWKPKAEILATPRPLSPPVVSISHTTEPTLADMWDGRAHFILDVAITGLPMGESETVIRPNGEWWSYVHASDRSAGTIDQCGDPVEFPGCTVIYKSQDDGRSFQDDNPPVCQFPCQQCPCNSEIDHIDQQQYPDLAIYQDTMYLLYEYRGSTKMRTSSDGLTWSAPQHIGGTGHWRTDFRPCTDYEQIGQHPFVPYDYECLAGAPPGVYVIEDTIYALVGTGQNPGHLSCYKGRVGQSAHLFEPCKNNPLLTGATEYGPLELKGAEANPYWDFRTISSAELLPVETPEGRRYYLMYEGLRGPGPNDPGDTQFGLGLARSLTDQIDGPWEAYPLNPILVTPPANIGLGHADLLVDDGKTYLYTSLDGTTRSRLVLAWK